MADDKGNGAAVAVADPDEVILANAPDLNPVIPGDMSQTTRIESARAIAEVQAQVVVARRFPRRMSECVRQMRQACSQPLMAEQAFWSYPRGGEQLTGPTVGLLREIARCFGNVQSGIGELERQPGRSEMIAWAWDLEQNVRMSTTFWVEHRIDRAANKGGPIDLTSGRDIYENNANMGARRERAMLERILPAWYVEEAKRLAHATLQGTPEEFPERLAKAVESYAGIGVRQTDLEDRLGTPRPMWTAVDLGTLLVLWQTIKRGETTLAAEFPRIAAGSEGGAAETLAHAAEQAMAATEPGKGQQRAKRRRAAPAAGEGTEPGSGDDA
jgi:hypothetical protein